MPDLSLKNLKHKFWGTSRRSFGCIKEAQRRERNRHTESRRGDGKKFWVLFETTQSSAWRRQWHPTPALLPGKSHGQRSPVGCSPWGREESDTTEQLPFHFSLSCIGEGNGNLLQCSCLENPRDGGAWWAAVSGVAQSRTWLKWLSSSSSSIYMSIPISPSIPPSLPPLVSIHLCSTSVSLFLLCE